MLKKSRIAREEGRMFALIALYYLMKCIGHFSIKIFKKTTQIKFVFFPIVCSSQ